MQWSITIAKKVPELVNAKTPTLGTTVSVWTASFYKRINRLDSSASLCIVLKRQVKGNILIGWAAAIMMPCLGGVADLDLTVDLVLLVQAVPSVSSEAGPAE